MTQYDLYSAFMMDHAAGTLPAPLALAADVHEALHADAKQTTFIWELVGGAFLDMETIGAEPDVRAKLRSQTGATRLRPEDILKTDLHALPWRRALGQALTSSTGQDNCRFLKIESRKRMPTHKHDHFEAIVVLEGAFEDENGQYYPGDICLSEPGSKHTPTLIGDEPCICFVGKDGGWLSNMVGYVTGH